MAMSWLRGLGLVVLLTMTGSASAQFEREFGKKDFGEKGFGKKDFGKKDLAKKESGKKGAGKKDFGKKSFDKKSFDKKIDGGKEGLGDLDRVRADLNDLRRQIDLLKQQIGDTRERLERLQSGARNRESGKGASAPAGRPEAKGFPTPGRGPGGFPKGGPGGFGKGFPQGGGNFKGPAFGPGFGPQPKGGLSGVGGQRPANNFEDRFNRLERSIDELRRDIRNRR